MSFYIGSFPAATTDADWAYVLDLIDDTTDAAFDATDYEFTLEITDCGSAMLTAKTSDATMDRPSDSQISWRFTKAQMGGLCNGTTYKVGCVAEDGDGNITQIFVADLPVIDGGIA